MSWTPERTELLLKLWKAGETINVIAAELGVGRGAISGKIWRLGLSNRGQDWFGKFGHESGHWKGGKQAFQERRNERRRRAYVRTVKTPKPIVEPYVPPVKKIKPGRLCAFVLGFRDG